MNPNEQNTMEIFNELYESHVDAIFRFCYFKTGDREVAKDLSQDVFIKLYKHLGKEKIDNPKSFVYTIAKNTIIDYWRKSKSITESNLPEGFFESLAESDHTETRQDYSTFLKLLDKLSPKDREVINLRYVEDLSSRDMAEILGERENTVLVRINRAKERLKNLLDQQNKNE